MKAFALMLGLAICCGLFWIAFKEKDPQSAAVLGYFAGLWGQITIRNGAD